MRFKRSSRDNNLNVCEISRSVESYIARARVCVLRTTWRTQTGVLLSVSVCGVGEEGGGGGGAAPCSSLDSCRRSGLAMCLSLDVLPTGCGLECWPCKPERAGSLLGPFSLHLL